MVERWALIGWLIAGCALPAFADPVVGGIVAREPNRVAPAAQSLFAVGADEVGQAPVKAALEPAARAFEEGKALYLDFKAGPAERSLERAVNLYLKQPESLQDTGPAVRAVLLLTQVQLARKRGEPARANIERALVELPGFPGDESPAPDVAALIERVRGTMAKRARPLKITSEPSGLEIRINGMAVGSTPAAATVYAPIVTVAARGPTGPVGRRSVATRRAGTDVHFTVGVSDEAKPLLAAIRDRDAAKAWPAAAILQAEEDGVCVGLVDEEGVLVARLDARQKRAIGGHRVKRPSGLDGWRALGRYCGLNAPSNTPPATVQKALFGPADPVEPVDDDSGSSRTGWGWTAVGAGVASAATGVYFGLEAQNAADDFNARGNSKDEDAARSNAVGADIGYVLGGALIVTGLYLILSDD